MWSIPPRLLVADGQYDFAAHMLVLHVLVRNGSRCQRQRLLHDNGYSSVIDHLTYQREFVAAGPGHEHFALGVMPYRFVARRRLEGRNDAAAILEDVPRASLRFAANEVEYEVDVGRAFL